MKKIHVAISLILLAMAVGCSRPAIHSLWVDRELKMDGQDNEWQECLLYYDEKNRVMVGAYNDEQYLYVRVSSRNRALGKQAMSSGLALWFDLDGGQDEEFGIRYPVGAMGRPLAKGRQERPEPGGMSGRMERPYDGYLARRTQEPFTSGKVQILGPEEDQERLLEVDDAEAMEKIRVCAGHQQGLFVYEAKFSLQHLGGAEISGPLGMGIKTSAAARGGMGKPSMGMQGVGTGIGGPGGGVGGPGRGGGMGEPGGHGAFSDNATELWFKVFLAKPAR